MIEKIGEKLFKHLNWLPTLPIEPTLNAKSFRLLREGAFYILGRDKYFRPCLIMDAIVINRLEKEQPGTVDEQTFIDLFLFLYIYIRDVMFLPGHINYWINIVHFGHLGATELPRKPILAFAGVCQENLMFMLAKSFYVQTGWTLRTFYNGIKSFMAEETR